MPLDANGPTGVIVKGVTTVLYTATALPGVFSGKIRPQSLSNPADTVLVEFYSKTTPNAGFELEVSKVMKATDLHFYLTPLEAITGYRIDVTLENSSPSANMILDYEIVRGTAPI